MNPALFLFFLSPMIGEMLTGSTPPLRFFNRFNLLLEGFMYGAGAILVRELTLRWGKGWATVFALGAAYGILEEGVFCRSFFDPTWPDLLWMGGYGRWAGVNWVWSLNLTIYHALVSISVPIFLTMLTFPGKASQPWISPRWLKIVGALFLVDMVVCFFNLKPPSYATAYRPSGAEVLILAAVVLGLIFWARRLSGTPISVPANVEARSPHPFFLGVIALASTVLLFLITGIAKKVGLNFVWTIVITVALGVLVGSQLRKWASGGERCSDSARLTLGIMSLALVGFCLLVLSVLALIKLKAFGLLMLPVDGVVLFLVGRGIWRLTRLETVWRDLHPLALTFGALLPYILLGFLKEFHLLPSSPGKEPLGMSISSLAALLFLIWLMKRASPPQVVLVGEH